MPLILVSGYPSSGKTHRATQLVSHFNAKIQSSSDPHISRLTVFPINDQSLGISRDVYREARTEKEARGAQYSAIKRALGRDAIVVADGLNYIKGFRYQLYCEAKAVKTPSCVVRTCFNQGFITLLGQAGLMFPEVHIGTPIETCRSINTRLLDDEEQDGGYEHDVFDNLIYRYEEPNGMTRWDSPLFTVPFDDEAPPYEAIWEAMIGSDAKAKVVKPNTATVLEPATESDYLYELDKITQEVLSTILAWQKDHPGEGGQELTITEDNIVELPATPVSLPQLQRIRRQFISLNRQHKLPKSRIRTSFVEYLVGSLSS